MEKKLTACGCNCSECEYFKNAECSGCSKIQGKVWWANHVNADICPIYDCVKNKKKFGNCGVCSEIPCTLWRDLQDPRHTDAQHEDNIRNRVGNLKKRP